LKKKVAGEKRKKAVGTIEKKTNCQNCGEREFFKKIKSFLALNTLLGKKKGGEDNRNVAANLDLDREPQSSSKRSGCERGH